MEEYYCKECETKNLIDDSEFSSKKCPNCNLAMIAILDNEPQNMFDLL
ncbi:unnamed protein product [marine sediment metagenome]|uniref:Uncharacterized protein n=1 Tax=marine sediment metagenome TaxID=412755 RepID=X1B8Z3_9ZZZZ